MSAVTQSAGVVDDQGVRRRQMHGATASSRRAVFAPCPVILRGSSVLCELTALVNDAVDSVTRPMQVGSMELLYAFQNDPAHLHHPRHRYNLRRPLRRYPHPLPEREKMMVLQLGFQRQKWLLGVAVVCHRCCRIQRRYVRRYRIGDK